MGGSALQNHPPGVLCGCQPGVWPAAAKSCQDVMENVHQTLTLSQPMVRPSLRGVGNREQQWSLGTGGEGQPGGTIPERRGVGRR